MICLINICKVPKRPKTDVWVCIDWAWAVTISAGHKCGRTPQGGKPCNTVLDEFGRHAGLCNKGLYTKRHDLVRDHIAKVARQAGLTAQIEP